MSDVEHLVTVDKEEKTENWGTELSDSLRWMHERAWPLGGALIFTATLYLHGYIMEEKLPLSILSPAFFSALPTMLGLVVFMVVALTVTMLVPTMILLTPINKSGQTVLELPKPNQTVEEKNRSGWKKRTLVMWACTQLVIGLVLLVLIFVLPPGSSGALVRTTSVGAVFVFWLVLLDYLSRHGEIPFTQISSDYWFVSLGSFYVQLIVMISVVLIGAGYLHEGDDHNLYLAVRLFTSLIGLVIVQTLGAVLMADIQSKKARFRRVAISVSVVVFLAALYPVSSAKLAGYALQMTASGGRVCSVFKFVDGAQHKYRNLQETLLADKKGFSQPLRVLADVDGRYLVRGYDTASKATTFVLRSDVDGVDDCPKKDK